MDRGIYAASSGGLFNERRLEIVANNLANVNTIGFKAQRLINRAQDFSDTLASKLNKIDPSAKGDAERTPGIVDIETVTDFAVGPIEQTGNSLNVALRNNNQFFVVSTANGEAYTRAGNFSLDQTGTLVTPDGLPILGEGGAVSLPEGTARITSSGNIVINGENVARLRVVEVDDLSELKRAEGTRFVLQGGAQARTVDAEVIPGALEMANVGIVESMVGLISAQRSFEAYQKTVQSIDQLNDVALRVSRAQG